MKLDRLTQRAKRIIVNVSDDSLKVDVSVLLKEIEDSEGMGNSLIQSFPEIRNYLRNTKKVTSLHLDELIKKAYFVALKLKQSYVGSEHLLIAALALLNYGDLKQLKEKLVQLTLLPKMSGQTSDKSTPIIDTYGVLLNQRVIAEAAKPIIERKEFESLVSILLQRKNPNALLIGEPNVGKRTLIDLLARKINAMDVPPALIGYRVIEFDLLAFITTLLNKANPEYGMLPLFDELKSLGRVILSIKNFQNMFYSTNMGVAMPLAYATFKAGLEETDVSCVATMSSSLYAKVSADNEHLFEGFTVLNVAEPNEEESLAILKANARLLSDFHRITISDDLLLYLYRRAKEELPDTRFPQKGIDLLDQACAKLILRKKKVPVAYKDLVEKSVFLTEGLDKSIDKGNYDDALEIEDRLLDLEDEMWKNEKRMFSRKKLTLTKADITGALTAYTAGNSTFDQSLSSFSTLDQRIKRRIIGQDTAVEMVSRALIRSKLGLRTKKRPLGCFLFLGPTGVGKTELAKVLAQEAFGEDSLLRLDMSDFSEKHNVARLVGAPPGYVGYGEGGELTTKIEDTPQSVVLFDEIEKAHPDVLNILLQIMEEGELVDARGNTFDFSKAVVILTSNLGTDIIHRPEIGFYEKVIDDSKLEESLKANLKKILKPELLNRLDEVIVFRRLAQGSQQQILDLILEDVRKTLKLQNIKIRISKEAKELLLNRGYSQEYGARSLRRTVERELLDKIAEVLLKVTSRPLNLNVVVEGKELRVEYR